MNNKGEVSLRSILIALAVIGAVLLGSFAFIQDQTTQAGNPAAVQEFKTKFKNTTNNLNETFQLADDLKEELKTADLISVEGLAALFRGSYAALRLVLNEVGLPILVFIDISNFLGLPPWVLTLLITVSVLVVSLLILKAVLGRGTT